MKMRNSGNSSILPSSPLDLLRAEVLSHFKNIPEEQRDMPTALPYLSFIRFVRPTELSRGMLEPSMCLVLQGKKKVLIGTEITHYGSGSYVLSAIDMPVSGQVTEASVAEPYLGVRIALDAKEIAAQIIDGKIAIPKNSRSRAGAYVEASD
ncbi:AraC family transcriptional regulator, partial [Undibacterium sp.]|uniref:AraC family transcriptional regulator n=1 Tax=Undibacterium sp. TaxID=1914977 RepID=UPI002BE6C403